MKKPLAALILAAGRGERMNSDLPKVVHKAAGFPLIGHVIETVREAGVKRIGVVISDRSELPSSFLDRVETVIQKKRLGTGHAVMQAQGKFGNWPGDLLVLPGDAPCIRTETLRKLIGEHREN